MLDPSSKSSSYHQGFSLVEMLVSLAVLSLISTLLMGATVQFRSLMRIAKANDVEIELQAVDHYLHGLFSQARSLSLIKDNPQRNVVFNGTPQNMHFAGIVKVGSDQWALRDVELIAKASNKSFELIQRDGARRSNSNDQDWQETPILSRINALSFQYDASVSENGTTQWQEHWIQTDVVPRAIKITLSLQREGQSFQKTWIYLMH